MSANLIYFRCNPASKDQAAMQCQHSVQEELRSFWLHIKFETIKENYIVQKTLKDQS